MNLHATILNKLSALSWQRPNDVMLLDKRRGTNMRANLVLFVSVISLFGSISSIAAARDVYVNNLSGSNRNSGELAGQAPPGKGPTRTIQHALRIASYGDRIVVANTGEPYRECLSLQTSRNSGSVSYPFVIEGNGAILDGSGPIPVEDWEPASGDVLSFQPAKLKSYQQIFVDGKPAARNDIDDKHLVKDLKPMEWCRIGQRLYFRVEKGNTPADYDLQHSVHRTGITLYGVQNVEIRNLIVQGFQIDGVSVADNAFDCKLTGVTARGNGRSGVNVGGASRVILDACVIGDNAVSQVRTEGWSNTVVVASDLLDTTAPAYQIAGGKLTIDGDVKERTPPILHSNSPLHRP